eukprot:TRINITY_DN312_c0_g1_i1.p1 TRINITY_DN312_c0_g1~~TRINITY_DN312_c0_g1_i1.p1  ORF type:complete len:216 (-),score=41.09 TRINITY_DN312_c0_g1_i1:137-784(-)
MSDSRKLLQTNITIHADNISKDCTLMCMFTDPKNQSLFKEQFPVVWKVLDFKKDQNHSHKYLNYNEHFGLAGVRIDDKSCVKVVTPVYTDILLGDSLTLNKHGCYEFSEKSSGFDNPGPVTIYNETGALAPICFGFECNSKFNPLLVQAVEDKKNVVFDFHPILSIYLGTGSEQESTLTLDKPDLQLVWSKSLETLGKEVDLNLRENGNGSYSLE